MSALAATAEARTAGIVRYVPGRAARRRGGKLSSNEAPLGPSPRARAAIARAAADAHRYPELDELRAALAARLGVAAAQVVLTNGSDELCYLTAAVYLEPGAPVVLSDPCYRIDEIATRVQQGEPRFVPLAPGGGHDLDAMAQAAQSAALVWLPSPHNPTGVAVDPGSLRAFLASVPPDCLVVLDEAYRGYVAHERRPDVPALIAAFPNLLVQRTFSKDFGLAGMRVGYGLGATDLIAPIEAVKPPFNVGVAAQAAATAALADEDWRRYGIELVRRERDRLAAHVAALGFEQFRSEANFVTVRVPDAGCFLAALERAGIAVRDGAQLGLPGWLRITIGSPPEMAVVRRLLSDHKERLP